MKYTLPKTESELYTKGSATLDDGNEITFEVPAVFVGGQIDETESVKKIEDFINVLNRKINAQAHASSKPS